MVVIKKISRLLVFVLALLITIYGAFRFDILPKNLTFLIPKNFSSIPSVLQNTEISRVYPDWTEDDVIKKINDYRASTDLGPLKLNEKLSNAAKNRLAVILEFNDYEGSQTGLTRENALKNVNYNYSWVGDLVLLDGFKINDPIDYWTSIDNSLSTLKDKNLKEVGIAIKQDNTQISMYVMLGAAKNISAETTTSPSIKVKWGGPELWEAVNKSRETHGVNPLQQRDELCTIASIRLNQLLQKGELDGHEGFVPTLNRPDLKWISEKYNTSEFLAYGYKTVNETINGWLGSLGHKKLLTGGEYVWGCIYASNTFAVAITAY